MTDSLSQTLSTQLASSVDKQKVAEFELMTTRRRNAELQDRIVRLECALDREHHAAEERINKLFDSVVYWRAQANSANEHRPGTPPPGAVILTTRLPSPNP